MIISHQHRFIFAAIPKTGTHSVRQALREHMSPDDLEQVGLFVNKRFPFAELAGIAHGHLTLQQVRPFIGEEVFSGYFKFAFVRNPFDRFVSYCAFMARKDGHSNGIRSRSCAIALQCPAEDHVLFQPQHGFITGENGELLTDQVGRVEDMQTSYDAICQRIGIPSRALTQVNSSRRGSYRDYYDQPLKDGVRELYRRDFELFGYNF